MASRWMVCSDYTLILQEDWIYSVILLRLIHTKNAQTFHKWLYNISQLHTPRRRSTSFKAYDSSLDCPLGQTDNQADEGHSQLQVCLPGCSSSWGLQPFNDLIYSWVQFQNQILGRGGRWKVGPGWRKRGPRQGAGEAARCASFWYRSSGLLPTVRWAAPPVFQLRWVNSPAPPAPVNLLDSNFWNHELVRPLAVPDIWWQWQKLWLTHASLNFNLRHSAERMWETNFSESTLPVLVPGVCKIWHLAALIIPVSSAPTKLRYIV